MIKRLRQSVGKLKRSSRGRDLHFEQPLLLFQSDDWGRVGVRDRDGWEALRSAGIDLGTKPYDFYSLETADDLEALSAVLRRHQDSVGRKPSVVMNFITANVDFARSLETGRVFLRPLSEGLPAPWERPGLLAAYQNGMREGLFFPALHGSSHFCERAISRELVTNGERADLLSTMWRAHTPYIYWRMPWIGYEYWDPEQSSDKQFLSIEEQSAAIGRAVELYRSLFGDTPISACAPGYRANADTMQAWFAAGVRVVQCGPGGPTAPSFDENGMLSTFRNVEMEPATSKCTLEALLSQVEICFGNRVPAVVSIHSINFHSTLKDFRTPTLHLLDEFLGAVETRWPNVLYIHDGDLYRIATENAQEDLGTAASGTEGARR